MAKSLPWSWYSDPDVLRREQERIFRRAWQYVGHTGRVEQVGDRFAAWAGEIPVLVVRAEDGVRAFLNVCRHRGSLLVDGDGSGKSVQCPYHAWTYDLDGSLRAAPRSDREPEFDSEGLSLVQLRLETWGPFLFVNPDDEAPPLADTLGPVTELVPVDDLVFHLRDDYEPRRELEDRVRELPRVLPLPGRAQGLQRRVRRRPRRVPARPQLRPCPLAVRAVPRRGRGAFSLRLAEPEDQRARRTAEPLDRARSCPPGPERSTGFLDYFFAADADPAWVEELLEFDRQVGAEDRVLVERVQKGVRSGIVAEGQLLGESEQLVARFQELVTAAVA